MHVIEVHAAVRMFVIMARPVLMHVFVLMLVGMLAIAVFVAVQRTIAVSVGQLWFHVCRTFLERNPQPDIGAAAINVDWRVVFIPALVA